MPKFANLQPLYNEERKKAYISTIPDEAGRMDLYRLFQRFAPSEFELDIDIVDMPVEVLQPIFSKVAGLSTRSIKRIRYLLQRYDDWCVAQGFTSGRVMYELEALPPIEKVKTEMVSSPTHLMKILDECFDPAGSNTIDAIRRAILWLAFANFTLEDDLDVKVSDVDLNALKVRWAHSTGDDYVEYRPLYIQAKPDFEFLMTSDFLYVNYNHRSENRVPTKIPRVEGDWLLRGTHKSGGGSNDSSVIQGLWHTTKAKLSKQGYNIAVDKLRRSGIFYRMYEDERAGIPADFSTISMTEVDARYARKGIKPTMDMLPSIENKIRQTRDQFEDDYKVWKSAFAV